MTDAASPPLPDAAKLDVQVKLMRRIESLEGQQKQLQKRNTGLLIGLVLMAGLWVAFFAVGVQRGLPGFVSDALEAKRFVLRGADGAVRGVWDARADGTQHLEMRGANGQGGLTLTVLGDGAPGVAFADAEGHRRLVLGVLPDQTTSIVLADGDGNTRAALSLSKAGASTLAFADRNGRARAGIGVDQSGVGTFTLFDRPTEDVVEAEPADSVPAQP